MPETEAPQPNTLSRTNPPDATESQPEETEDQTVSGKTETSEMRAGLLNLLFPKGLLTMAIAMFFDTAGFLLMLCDLIFGIGEIFSWIFDDFLGGVAMYFLLRNVGQSNIALPGLPGKQTGQTVQKAGQAAQKAGAVVARGTPFLKFFGGALLGKVVPIVGGIIPFWTILTIMTYSKS